MHGIDGGTQGHMQHRRLLLSVLAAGIFSGCAAMAEGFAQGMSQNMTTVQPAAQVMSCNDSCTSVFNYCIRITCQVTNHGGGGGQVNVRGIWRSRRGDLSLDQSLYLAPYGTQTVAVDVKGARLIDGGGSCLCEAR